jgi:aminoglycoside phosphotransferase (APT) family kinase protein
MAQAEAEHPGATTRGGAELIGDGREAETLAWGEGAVLRLLKDPRNAERLQRERHALGAAREASVPVPRLLGEHTLNGRPGLILERVAGSDLLSQLATRPWTLPAVGRALGGTHARIHRAVAPGALPTVHEALAGWLHDAAVPDRFRAPALTLLETLPRGDALCHWDFHPANLLASAKGPVVIDWTFALRGHPSADVARTILILMGGEPPDGKSLLTKRVDPLGRRALARVYWSSYRRSAALDRALVERWGPLVALARLTAGIPAERAQLLARVERGLAPAGR